MPLDEEDLVRATEMMLAGIAAHDIAIRIFLDRLAAVEETNKLNGRNKCKR